MRLNLMDGLHGLCCMMILHKESKFKLAVADLHGLCSMAILQKEANSGNM